ncbi:MAG: hypothetical protein WD575_03005, partial [Nitriliruptoraceae bacterium]
MRLPRRQPATRRVARAKSRRSNRRPDRSQLRDERRRQRAEEAADRRDKASRYRRLGGPRGQRRPFAGRTLWEARLEPFEASTASLEAVFPFQTGSATDADQGIVIGTSPTGGTFCWDPWTLYQAGRLTNPNVLILGDVGSGKSSLAKT